MLAFQRGGRVPELSGQSRRLRAFRSQAGLQRVDLRPQRGEMLGNRRLFRRRLRRDAVDQRPPQAGKARLLLGNAALRIAHLAKHLLQIEQIEPDRQSEIQREQEQQGRARSPGSGQQRALPVRRQCDGDQAAAPAQGHQPEQEQSALWSEFHATALPWLKSI
ncbi:hypothetical protein GALL_498400 [mine drainage metagenome]|uniref:Uncharacterized protein n=1 Tax=mine drainage metagenome TaxID=410659 RepID=A0A1J5PLA7_9ZZZZ